MTKMSTSFLQNGVETPSQTLGTTKKESKKTATIESDVSLGDIVTLVVSAVR